MKLRPVTKLDKRDKTPSKKFYDDVMWENYDVIANLLLIWSNPESRHIVYKTCIVINSNLLSYKN